jgi:superfamily I DNA/RNA helicase
MASVTGDVRLDPTQQRVVEHGAGSLVYLAAPGTGATTGLAHAIARRTRRDGAASVLAVTAGRRSASDLRSRIAALLGSGALPTVTTIHALAYSLISTYAASVGEGAVDDELASVRVLSGAEEDQRIRDLITGSIVDATVAWPDSLRDALPTLGFANEVRAFLARLREQRIDPVDALDRARRTGDPLLMALVEFAVIEAQTATLENIVDYSGLLTLATSLVAERDVSVDLHSRVHSLYIDGVHDMDGLQVALLCRVVGPDAVIVAAGDPARSIYGFRGSDPRAFAEFIERRRDVRTGAPPQIVVAGEVHRGNARTHRIAARVLAREVIEGIPTDAAITLRRPVDGDGSDSEASIEVLTGDNPADLHAHVGRLIREVHLRDGVPWSQIAVITRTTATAAAAKRSLEAAGVPVATESIDLALPDEPAVATMLQVVEAAAAPDRLTVEAAAVLMGGPVFAADAGESRVLARTWRALLRERHPDVVPARFEELQRDVLLGKLRDEHADLPVEVRDLPAAQRLIEASELLARVSTRIARGAPPAQVLWEVWSGALPDTRGTSWPERLRRAALGGHRASGHDLDAVLALFATAERLTERFRGVVGAAAFVAAIRNQRVPAEAISQRGAIELQAVTVLTAHHAQDRSWHTVVILDAQEGTWPRPGARGGLLDAESLVDVLGGDVLGSDVPGSDAPADAPGSDSAMDRSVAAARALDADRRLFYTALTRARHRTVIAAVAAATEGGAQPSRFITDLRAESDVPLRHVSGRPARPHTLAGHVAGLRTRLLTATGSDRETLVAELAALARLADDAGRPLVPSAHPRTWWHALESTRNDLPLRPASEPVRLSASALQALDGCPLRWFLDRQVRSGRPSGAPAALGIAVHTLAEAVASGVLPPDPEVLGGELERIWPHLGFDIPWYSVAQHERVRSMLERLCAFSRRRDRAESRDVVGVEVELAGEIDLRRLAELIAADRDDPGIERMREIVAPLSEVDARIGVTGRIDQVERDADGRLSLLDVKTTANPPSAKDVVDDLQLALYQAAVLTDAIADEDRTWATPVEIDHAALVVVGVDAAKDSVEPKSLHQPALTEHPDPEWFFTAVSDAIAHLRRGDYPPRPGSLCRTCDFTSICPTDPTSREVP